MSLAFPKPAPRRKRRARPGPIEAASLLAAHYDRVSLMPSVVSGARPVVLHHVPTVSPKTRQRLRKRGAARAAVVPLTDAEHRRLHELESEEAYEREAGLPDGFLAGVALYLLSETVVGT